MKIWVLVALAMYGSVGMAETRVSAMSQCSMTGFADEAGGQARTLPFVVRAQMSLAYIEETGQVISSSFSGWLTDAGSGRGLPDATRDALGRFVFTASTYHPSGSPFAWWMPLFDLRIAVLLQEDLAALWRHAAGEDADMNGPWVTQIVRTERSGAGATVEESDVGPPWSLSFVVGDFFESTEFVMRWTLSEGRMFGLRWLCE